MTVEERFVFQGGATIDQGQERVEVSAWPYSKEAAPAVSLAGHYHPFDNSPEIHTGPEPIVFSSGDEADCVITHASPTSGRFAIDGPLREISRRRFTAPPQPSG
jgi:hypothetical protein